MGGSGGGGGEAQVLGLSMLSGICGAIPVDSPTLVFKFECEFKNCSVARCTRRYQTPLPEMGVERAGQMLEGPKRQSG